MKKFDFDLVVIGSGVVGRSGAIMARSKKLKVAIVEDKSWGGFDLKSYTLPMMTSKKLSDLYFEGLQGAKFGLSSTNLRYNYPTVDNWRKRSLKRFNFKKSLEDYSITTLKGRGYFISPFELVVGSKQIRAKKFLIATGTKDINYGISGVSKRESDGLIECLRPHEVFSLKRLPKTTVIIGAGQTGCELASYLAQLGVQVTLIEKESRILPKEDKEISEALGVYFAKFLKIKIILNAKVHSMQNESQLKRVIMTQSGSEKSIKTASIILATGVKPEIDLGLENAGVDYDLNGIKTNKYLQTSVKHIYAAGNIISRQENIPIDMSAYEGTIAASNIVSVKKLMPSIDGFSRIIHTYPEVRITGVTETECIRRKIKYKKSMVETTSIMQSDFHDFNHGFVKLLADKDLRIIGASMVGINNEAMQEVSMAIRLGIKVNEIISTPHSMLSWGEMIRLSTSRIMKK